MSIRPVKRLVKAKPTLEDAGVHLRRAFGFGDPSEFDAPPRITLWKMFKLIIHGICFTFC